MLLLYPCRRIVQLKNISSGKNIEVGQNSDRSLFKVFKNRSAITLKSMEINLTKSKRQFEMSSKKDSQHRIHKVQAFEELSSNVKNTSELPVERTCVPVTDGDDGEGRKDDSNKNYKTTFSVHEADARSVKKAVLGHSIVSESSWEENHEKVSCGGSACKERLCPRSRTKSCHAGCYSNEMSDTEITASES